MKSCENFEKFRKVAHLALGKANRTASMLFYEAKLWAQMGGMDLDAPNPEWHREYRVFPLSSLFLAWFTSGGNVCRVELRRGEETLEVFEKL